MDLHPGYRRLPREIWQEFLHQTARTNPPAARRMALLSLLWSESFLSRQALIARVEALSGVGCFGKHPLLTFARDIKFVRDVLKAAGHQLRYSRRTEQPGYYIPGRPLLDPHLVKVIHAAVDEVDPEQVAIYARLSPAQRMHQGASLSDYLRQQAARLIMRDNPEFDEAEANREALRRMYRSER